MSLARAIWPALVLGCVVAAAAMWLSRRPSQTEVLAVTLERTHAPGAVFTLRFAADPGVADLLGVARAAEVVTQGGPVRLLAHLIVADDEEYDEYVVGMARGGCEQPGSEIAEARASGPSRFTRVLAHKMDRDTVPILGHTSGPHALAVVVEFKAMALVAGPYCLQLQAHGSPLGGYDFRLK